MAFVMVSTGALTSSGVRTLSVRSLVIALALLAAVLLAAGAALGYLFARSPTPVVALRAGGPNRYTVEQLGVLSGRVFKLESEAALLARKIGVLHDYEARQAKGKGDGKGGPMLAPRQDGRGSPTAELDAALTRIERDLALIGQATAQRNLAYMSFPSRPPVEQIELRSLFGNRTDPITHRQAFHAGLDFAADIGTPIYSAAGGKVIVATHHPEFGWMVEVDHGNGLVTRYAHSSRLMVKTGDLVTPHQLIALSGSSGRSTGPHLHFEVIRNGEYADPRNYLAGL